MMTRRIFSPVCASAVLAATALWPVAWGFAHAQVGSVIENVELPALAGAREPLLSNATANVFIFFKPGQEHSQTVMQQMAKLEKELAGKPVYWVAIISDSIPPSNAVAEVQATGLTMPVLIDVGDALYGKLGVALEPVTGITDQDHKLVAYQAFTQINYVAVIRARVRHLLKEIDDAELERVLHPPAATQGGAAVQAHRRLKLAEKLFQAGNLGKALESVEASLAKDQTVAAAQVLRGRILSAQGNWAEARKAFARAIQLDPENTDARDGQKACEEKLK